MAMGLRHCPLEPPLSHGEDLDPGTERHDALTGSP